MVVMQTSGEELEWWLCPGLFGPGCKQRRTYPWVVSPLGCWFEPGNLQRRRRSRPGAGPEQALARWPCPGLGSSTVGQTTCFFQGFPTLPWLLSPKLSTTPDQSVAPRRQRHRRHVRYLNSGVHPVAPECVRRAYLDHRADHPGAAVCRHSRFEAHIDGGGCRR